jgi:L-alanine-DL-glutamate epimerase-like enolase superfamily enzyme
MEYPWRSSQRAETWYTPNFTIKDGKIQIPQGPGLGIEIDPAYLKTAESVVKIDAP